MKILFVCHGNICRSPMAEYVMKDLVRKAGLENEFEIASAATSDEETGNGIYPPVKRLLEDAGIECSSHRARQLSSNDYQYYDLIVAMDRYNIRNMERSDKIRLLLSFTGSKEDIADPWYTRNFNLTWNQVNAGCKSLLDWCLKHLHIGS